MEEDNIPTVFKFSVEMYSYDQEIEYFRSWAEFDGWCNQRSYKQEGDFIVDWEGERVGAIKLS